MILLGTTTVGTAGTAVQLINNAGMVKSITLKAPTSNSDDGAIYIGYTPEDPATAVAEANGFRLGKGEQITIDDLECVASAFYADSASNGDKVTWAIDI